MQAGVIVSAGVAEIKREDPRPKSTKPRIVFPIKDPEVQYIGAMVLSSVLKLAGYEVEAVVAEYEAVASLLSANTLTILAFTTLSVFALHYQELNRRLKRNFKVYSIFGGWHPTYYPEMIQEEGVDAICVGEGEYAMRELADRVSAGLSPRDIPNLWVKEGGRIFKNPVRPLIKDLDEVPLPDRNFLSGKAAAYYHVIATVVTQRSCPFKCSFCVNQAYNELYKDSPRNRRRSVDNVIEELRQLKARGTLEFVKFEDSIFITQPEWIREFAVKYPRAIGVPFVCYVRAEMVTPEILRHLKAAGCASVSMGVECGDDETRRTILNKPVTNERIIEAARLIKQHGLGLRTMNILGLPGCGIAEDFKTLKLNIAIRPDYATSGLMQPYPGTGIYEYARAKRLIPERMEDYLETLPVDYNDSPLKFCSAKEKRMTRNLVRLFPVAVGLPFLVPLVKLLIRLPRNGVFKAIYTGWKGYCFFFRVWPVSFRNVFTLLKRYRRLA